MKLFGFFQVGFIDVLDVLLMTLIVYVVLRVLRGTKAIILLMGVGVLLLVGFVAESLGLAALGLLISTVKAFGIVALIILFQPEIRRLLIEIGSNPFLRFVLPPERVPLNELILAVDEIRKNRWGALIVIQRRVSLMEYAEETGTIMDAYLSAPLLVAIFSKGSPLHDGAVIIKESRILASTVMLPMSVRIKGVGARHRAGAGITEVSDAISIVVSEEKGTITLFHRGEPYTNLTIPQLRKLLKDLLNYEE